MTVGFGYGALFDPIESQANKQGFTLGEMTDKIEERRNSILILMFSNILTSTQTDKCIEKLNKQVLKALKPLKEEQK